MINRFAEILLQEKFIQECEYNKICNTVSLNNSLEEIFISNESIDENKIYKILKKEFFIETIDTLSISIGDEAIRLLSKEDVKKYCIIPLAIEGDRLSIAMSNPLNMDAIEDISFITNKKVIPYYDKKVNIYSAIENHYSNRIATEALQDLKSINPISEVNLKDRVNFIEEAPVVKLTDTVINQAINKKASDIHLDPFNNGTIVRFRLDGILKEHIIIPKNIYPSVCTRIKIKSGMDISKKMVPQDGKMSYKYENRDLDLRISSIPTFHGEKITIRILDRSNKKITIDNIIYDDKQRQELREALCHQGGIILVTGPTARELKRQQFTSSSQSWFYFFLRSPKKFISISPVLPSQYMLSIIEETKYFFCLISASAISSLNLLRFVSISSKSSSSNSLSLFLFFNLAKALFELSTSLLNFSTSEIMY